MGVYGFLQKQITRSCALVFSLFFLTGVSFAEPLSFQKLWNGHPLNNSVTAPAKFLKEEVVDGKQMKVGMPAYPNQCAIRMGVSLKNAGLRLEQIGNPRVSWLHDKNEMYVLVAQELANGLAGARIEGLGPTEKITGEDAKNFHKILYGRKGIIFFKDYWLRTGEKNPTGDHIDVWNGYRTSAKWLMEWFSWLGYTENYGKSKEIWFWEVK